jgi:hypothetical protein
MLTIHTILSLTAPRKEIVRENIYAQNVIYLQTVLANQEKTNSERMQF